MKFQRDDMTIRMRLRQDRSTPRERAAEERRTRATARRRQRSAKLIRRTRAARGANRHVKGKRRPSGASRAKEAMLGKLKYAKFAASKAKLASRRIPFLGLALLANDAALFARDGARRALDSQSERLNQLQDNAVTMGSSIPEAAANSAALEYVEGDASRLRAIGEDGKMTGTLASNLEVIKKLEFERATGADMIRGDGYFDSADTLSDKLIKKAREAGLQAVADRVAHLIRTERGAKGKGK